MTTTTKPIKTGAAGPDGGLNESSAEALASFAQLLYRKRADPISSETAHVIVFVGAGASASAGLAQSPKLKRDLKARFQGTLLMSLYEEVQALGGHSHPPDQIIENWSLFEFAAVLSRSAYGRRILEETIQRAVSDPERRPLAYEILAHLAKHRWVDHFVALNFDALLDEAVEDELPERVTIITGDRDVPELLDDRCFLIHPFGLVGRKPFSVSTEDVNRLGPPQIHNFLHRVLPCPKERPSAPVVLLLLGYAAAEPAFGRFVESLLTVPGTGQQRNVSMYVVDVAWPPPDTIRDLSARFSKGEQRVPVQYISATADNAMEMLLALLAEHSKGDPVWIPGARHLLIGNCCQYQQVRIPAKRFKLELLLQGVKSRGFIHLEAFSHLPRLSRYGKQGARGVIQDLLERNVIEPDEWLPPDHAPNVSGDAEYVPNYMITENAAIVDELFPDQRRDIGRWVLEEPGLKIPRFRREFVGLRQFALERLAEIERAPEIEIDHEAARESKWILGDDAIPLESIQVLCRQTREVLERALGFARKGHWVDIAGIWSTGEWLFGDNGWAAELGKELLAQPTVSVRAIVTGGGGVRGTRSERRDQVVHKFNQPIRAHVELKAVNWWELNRVLTLVYVTDGMASAIYMRRRLSRPLVAPYLVVSHNGLRYLKEVWQTYYDRGHPITSPANPRGN